MLYTKQSCVNCQVHVTWCISENAQKIDFKCPEVKMSKFIKKNQKIGQFKLDDPKNPFFQYFQTCTMLHGHDN
jgi:hypothetical protein